MDVETEKESYGQGWDKEISSRTAVQFWSKYTIWRLSSAKDIGINVHAVPYTNQMIMESTNIFRIMKYCSKKDWG